MERKLQALLDKQEIIDLLHAYCNANDRHDQAKVRALYHEDAWDDHGIFFKGLAQEFVDKLPGIWADMEILHHNMTTMNIKVDGDVGEGEIYVLAFHKIKKPGGGSMDLLIGGRYLDRYAKRNGVWKFAHRSVLADWAVTGDPPVVALDSPILAGSYIGKPGPDDPSYGFFKILKRGER
ncbi:MAG: nuclear transport factor 2 family protein [Proteobacteria bacterium]|nr:nuclear transport factor 2 family protein [Pseudomonadota bacterium]